MNLVYYKLRLNIYSVSSLKTKQEELRIKAYAEWTLKRNKIEMLKTKISTSKISKANTVEKYPLY